MFKVSKNWGDVERGWAKKEKGMGWDGPSFFALTRSFIYSLRILLEMNAWYPR